MNTFFFGHNNLYGVYHEADRERDRESGVVLCSPIGLEYMRCYWAIRQLALRLARDGHHVLRFDYSHTGNSAGDIHQTDVDGWIEDILTAQQELKDIAAPRHFSMVGLRFGALVAARASARLPLQNLILWDPVISGGDYLDFLYTLNLHEHRNSYRYHPPRRLDPDADDLLGFSYPARLRDSLVKEHLSESQLRAARVVVVSSEETSALGQLVLLLKRKDIDIDIVTTREKGDWANPRLLNDALIVKETLEIIAERMT